MVKKIFIALGILLILIQLIRPAKNDSGNETYGIATKYEVPYEVAILMENACDDCHTNKTRYPWYTNIQPVGWWLASHVKEGKQHLNFSEFTNRRIAYQNHKLEEIAEMVEEKKMPLPSYTWLGLHPTARLNQDQRQMLIDWAKTQMAMLARQYPQDSLVLRKR